MKLDNRNKNKNRRKLEILFFSLWIVSASNDYIMTWLYEICTSSSDIFCSTGYFIITNIFHLNNDSLKRSMYLLKHHNLSSHESFNILRTNLSSYQLLLDTPFLYNDDLNNHNCLLIYQNYKLCRVSFETHKFARTTNRHMQALKCVTYDIQNLIINCNWYSSCQCHIVYICIDLKIISHRFNNQSVNISSQTEVKKMQTFFKSVKFLRWKVKMHLSIENIYLIKPSIRIKLSVTNTRMAASHEFCSLW